MQTRNFSIDQGKGFGLWNDRTSRFIYRDSVSQILSKIERYSVVADYGGANGILKEFIPGIITVDIDASKTPDIVDNILTHKGTYELIIIRFVLHYLNDYEVLQLFAHLKDHHRGKILVIQFCNNDLKTKYFNSQNEFKYFRTVQQTEKLLPPHEKIYSKKYTCSKEFYLNRLKIENAKAHSETLNAYLI